jgi:hypothetical protein
MIRIEKQDADTFEVTIEEGNGASHHTVTVTDDYHQKLTGGSIEKKELLRRSFEFLLEREPKESILSRFDLPTIQRYVPQYEDQLRT